MTRFAMAALFEARDLAVSAGGVRLLEAVDLTLDPGELLAIVGPSGSGKTTLLRALALLSDPVAGTLALRSRTPEDWGYPHWRRRVSLVHQRPVLLDATLRANLARPFTYGTVASDLAALPEDRARAWLDRVGVGAGRLDQDALTLSEGQQQRASLVRTLLLAPDVLLLDEPTSALDSESAASVEALVRERVGEGAAGVVVTHDRGQAERWCDRVLDLTAHVAKGAMGA